MAKTPAPRVPGETGLTLIAPIVGREKQATDDTHNNYEQQRYHLFVTLQPTSYERNVGN